jgi:hypothetical protein
VVQPHAADLLAHLAAAGQYPVVGRGGSWHPSTLSTT